MRCSICTIFVQTSGYNHNHNLYSPITRYTKTR